MISLYNSRTRSTEKFTPLEKDTVRMYTCGPTVYHYAHIGNLRTYILSDIVKRTLKYAGYTVNHVMNITDVGHLTDDGDAGEDKIEKGATREGKTAREIADFYTIAFKKDLVALNILEPTTWALATEHIDEQIEQVQQLIAKGLTYETSDGIYMDTSQLGDYGELAELAKQDLQAGARVDMGEKKNPHDFALWKFSPEDSHRQMEWKAFGKIGFPGWHIECSAMAMKYLGDQFDLHLGAVDLKPVHHVNEIAQAEAVTEKKPWVNYWMHGEHMLMGAEKMSKSDGNVETLDGLAGQGFDPLAFRYFVLQAHYRKQLNFTKEALQAAAQGLKKLRKLVAALPEHAARDPHVREEFQKAMFDDLNTAEALATLWTSVKDQKIDTEMVIEFDKVLGLNLHNPSHAVVALPKEVTTLVDQRREARASKDWDASDALREELTQLGYTVEDTDNGQTVAKR